MNFTPSAGIQVAMAWGWLADGGHADGLLDRVLAMLWRLTNARQDRQSRA